MSDRQLFDALCQLKASRFPIEHMESFRLIEAVIRGKPTAPAPPPLSVNSGLWTSLEIILAAGQVLKAKNPLMAADIINNIQYIVEELEPLTESAPTDLGCKLPPDGWWCSRPPGHDGPCPTRQRIESKESFALRALVAAGHVKQSVVDQAMEIADHAAR